MENKSYCVYCHTNKINGKKYIGQTCQNPPEKRWRDDGQPYKGRNKNTGEYMQGKFARAIDKYGWENFEHEILKTGLTSQEADQWESYYISFFDSIKNGYNLTTGGKEFKKTSESRKKQSERMIREKHFNYGKHLSQETREKISKSQIRRKQDPEVVAKRVKSQIRGKRSEETKRKMSESAKKYSKNKWVPIMCVETEQIFNSIMEAESFLGLNNAHLSECCRSQNHCKTSGGYHWIYVSDIDKENWEKQKEKILNNIPYDCKCKKVICIETCVVYRSIIEAQRQTNIDSSSIGRCCQGKAQTAGKLHWAYYNEEEKEEKL